MRAVVRAAVTCGLCALLTAVGAREADAQETATVVGHAVDATTGERIGATVVLIADDPAVPPQLSGVTPGGLYHFEGVPRGTFRVQVLDAVTSVRFTVPPANGVGEIDIFGRVMLPDLRVRRRDEALSVDERSEKMLDGHDGRRVVGLLPLPVAALVRCGPHPPADVNTTAGRVYFLRGDRTPDGTECSDLYVMLFRTDGVIEEVPTLEVGYEHKAFIVLERVGRRARIALRNGSTWLTDADAQAFVSYPTLVVDTLAFLREGWDQRLWRTPGSAPPEAASRVWLEQERYGVIDVDVLEVRVVGGQPWVHVRLAVDRCGGDPPPESTLPSGWVPAYRSSGATNVWFYSRGC
ncbi:MAG: hypothetical protein U0P30_08525 [Vicinamibacterales bacterium]